jgi:hypothetical protein
VFQLVQLPEEEGANIFRAFYLQFDGVGYETYSASTTDMVNFKLNDPTLAPGQPGVVFSPREGRPPLNDVKPVNGDFDYGSQTFIGPLVLDYNVSAKRVLRRATPDTSFWYAYGRIRFVMYMSLAQEPTALPALKMELTGSVAHRLPLLIHLPRMVRSRGSKDKCMHLS